MSAPTGFKPMLASPAELTDISFPAFASPKLNGVRCIVFNGVAYSRSLKPLPNRFIQSWASNNAAQLEGFDGEIIVGSETDSNALNNTTSGVMSHDGAPDFTFHVFDVYRPTSPYRTRLSIVNHSFKNASVERTKPVDHVLLRSIKELQLYEKDNLEAGYEGTMVRHPEGQYKCGRSTAKQGWLIKRKIFVDDEFEIVGFEEKYHNNNPEFTNELGRTARSTTKENLVPAGTLGALICKTKSGHTFNVGTGFTDKVRDDLWSVRYTLVGKQAKIKFFPEGMQDVPLLPVFLQIRSDLDK